MITQNIDSLHAQAGSRRAGRGARLDRSARRAWSAAPRIALGEVDALFDEEGAACRAATAAQPLKPDVVLFGELLPAAAMSERRRLASRADLMLCVGSSLEVYPVAGLPAVTLGQRRPLAIVTMGPTPYDGDAAVRLDGDVVADLEAVLAAL